jgi:hypothetical protein
MSRVGITLHWQVPPQRRVRCRALDAGTAEPDRRSGKLRVLRLLDRVGGFANASGFAPLGVDRVGWLVRSHRSDPWQRDLRCRRARERSAAASPYALCELVAREGRTRGGSVTGRYRGGWQLLTPNAGSASAVGEHPHGFHGAASNEPWHLVDRHHKDSVAMMDWQGHGLQVSRAVCVEGYNVTVDTSWRAVSEPVPFVAVEHLALGPELFDPDCEIAVVSARAHELSERDGPLSLPSDGAEWPMVRLLSGELERADRWSAEKPRSRCFALTSLQAGVAEVRNTAAGIGLRLACDLGIMPYAWVWHELRGSGGRWRDAAHSS